MKILQTGEQQAVQNRADKLRGKPQTANDQFMQILENEMQPGVQSTSGTERCPALDRLAAPSQVDQVDAAMTLMDRQALSALDVSLGRLEEVQQSVSDQATSPKKIDEMISSLSRDVDSMQEKLASLPKEHPLRKIGNELSLVAHVESVKWRRGDYL